MCVCKAIDYDRFKIDLSIVREFLAVTVREDFLLRAVIHAMLGSKGSWVAPCFFCKEIVSRKEKAETVERGGAPPRTEVGAGRCLCGRRITAHLRVIPF